ncbi:nitrogenase iron-molybdenum cofactor biosynthesis protein NifE [Acetobacterium woodii]|uniref:Nitrogenase iron-molybdenum cofactor biosynthesis protein NifE n=1 Tax=Acetobacterium woodii (strain ATCC 29683 / DSM 1030 / JCM 2381 / KCTC 1655 / WB1) TaxID=931626 RepID=H6LKJ3_ACEWD|nr:nitrogenase iron-molybdenum cofactor biosynthesis protein NifE [Acetobacterium woodii]AFA47583.1 nitrogenase iron molybdenum cofactor biosynthesis protein NifE3 [Acetobacterium woodii DSM 1030]
MGNENAVLPERAQSIRYSECSGDGSGIKCEAESISGAVSQRACVFCGARVVLNPITDAFHIIHGPIGCASYTWDIRGSLSSQEEGYRNSYSTDLRERDVIFGGQKKLAAAVDEVVATHSPKVIFIYATCIVGVIGDDIDAVCRDAEEKYGIRVIPVKSPGFSGTKKTGYKMACNAIMNLVTPEFLPEKTLGVNILGDFNLAGEMWIIKNYLRRIGVKVVANITGDAKVDDLKKAPTAQLNLVQCAGSMTYLAKQMEEVFDIPFIKVSFFGVTDTSDSLMRIAYAVGDKEVIQRAKVFIEEEKNRVLPLLDKYKKNLIGKKAAIYVGGGFKAISLIRQFSEFGMNTVMVGTQTGSKDDYEVIQSLVDDDAVILDDANPAELEAFMKEMGADILVGGVKERPLAYKLGVAFCDHNHERKHPLAGYEGTLNFASEINLSMNSPVWETISQGGKENV